MSLVRELYMQQATWSEKANGRQPKTCLGRIFNYKLDCFRDVHELICVYTRPHL